MGLNRMSDGTSPTSLTVERSTVTKLVISGGVNLDPITVFLEDLGSRASPRSEAPDHVSSQGNLTIRCAGESWTSYWGGMGSRTVTEFVAKCSDEYILNCLSRGLSSTRFSAKALKQLSARCIIDRRRERSGTDWELGYLDADDARSLYRRLDEFRDVESLRDCWSHSELLSLLFGDEWHYPVDQATEPNPDYTYLLRIVQAVQQALTQPVEAAAA
ncbi:hypothetical protein ACLPJG_27015 [Pseudomonas aeruginosa]|jgi:hypothetical protein|uniref:Uncharacterized protein n=2 Tax=Pseudomonas TaxID=286 RepID=A0A3M4JV04_9PSED|nr:MULTISPECIES: hypothetical protein [Pseudomonas]AGZ38089.1 hypothetical protein PVLB_26762 [Pseudomonas sp. VLB120]MDM3951054.1 hypothetical protein [Pseudomonas alloputida]RMQ20868.1 hypothetical protein ALQ08_200019 [Pseudomonas syringae pv. delphinii]UPL41717.1 hypothetical protein MX621_31055 [Pseudomonas aeruginosa]